MQGAAWRVWVSWLSIISRLVLGAVFVIVSVDNALAPAHFADVVDAYNLLPDRVISPFAILLPWVEFIAGSLLLLGVASRSAAFVIFCLLMVFLVAISVDFAQGLTIDCGCFEAFGASDPIGWRTIFRDMGLAILSIHVMFFDRPTAGLGYWLDQCFARVKSESRA